MQECSNDEIKHQVDSLKTFYAKGGFSVVREASITMESEYEMPVIVPLQQGTWYQFIFIGDMSSKMYEVRMYDWEEREMAYQQKRWAMWTVTSSRIPMYRNLRTHDEAAAGK